MSVSRTPAPRPDALATDARQRLATALLRLEATPRKQPDAVLLQAESDLGDEEFDRALLDLYLAGLISYTNVVGVIGRLATATLGDETSYRLTPRGRAAAVMGSSGPHKGAHGGQAP